MPEGSRANPGLTYDPRNLESANFWAAVEADLNARLGKLESGGKGKGGTQTGVRPLQDPGRPTTANFPNPRLNVKPGSFAIRV
jgi:hypothetical protein